MVTYELEGPATSLESLLTCFAPPRELPGLLLGAACHLLRHIEDEAAGDQAVIRRTRGLRVILTGIGHLNGIQAPASGTIICFLDAARLGSHEGLGRLLEKLAKPELSGDAADLIYWILAAVSKLPGRPA